MNDDGVLKANINKHFYSKPKYYSILYDKMIEPLIPYKIKGFLWYQGEENVTNYYDYKELLSGMIYDWRDKWKEKLPFYFVQIALFLQIHFKSIIASELREAQRETLDILKKLEWQLL